MPKIEQYDWSKLKPAQPAKKATHSGDSKYFPTYKFVESKKSSKHGDIKVTTAPITYTHPLKCSRCSYNAGSRKDLNEHWLLDH